MTFVGTDHTERQGAVSGTTTLQVETKGIENALANLARHAQELGGRELRAPDVTVSAPVVTVNVPEVKVPVVTVETPIIRIPSDFTLRLDPLVMRGAGVFLGAYLLLRLAETIHLWVR